MLFGEVFATWIKPTAEKMKTGNRKQYETPSVGVVETTCAVIAASNVTLGAQQEDEDWLQLEEGTWGDLEETLKGI